MAFDDLPDNQQRAIEYLVLGDPDLDGKPMKYKDIAEKCDVAEFTLRRWRHDPRFQEAKREFRERIKGDIVDEAIKTLRRSMRTKDSTHAAEVALKWAGEMIERRAIEGNINTTQQIDIRSSDTQALLGKLKELHKELGLPADVELYIGQGDVVEGEIVDDSTENSE